MNKASQRVAMLSQQFGACNAALARSDLSAEPCAAAGCPGKGEEARRAAGGPGEAAQIQRSPVSAAATAPNGSPIDPEGVYIVGVARTALGSFQGGLASLRAPEIGAHAIKAALERSCIPGADVGEVIFGNVCSAGVGQSPARQASLGAGLPLAVDVTTVNKVCSSGLKAVAFASQAIRAGDHSIIVAGGMESMSNVPYYVPALRAGARLGDSKVIDGMIRDGLWDPYNDIHMGECAERVADEFGVTRADMDRHALNSVARAEAARASGAVAWEIAPLTIKDARSGKVTVFDTDEPVSKMDAERLPKLRPSFRRTAAGRVTAGNSSPITDGAAALVLASGAEVIRRGLSPLALVRATADAALEPDRFPVAPSLAAPRALAKAGLTARDVDAWEFNEAFSVVHIVNRGILDIPDENVNAFGGAVALGHPIGASGARILVTLINVLRSKRGRIGVAAICNGGGGASSAVLEYVGKYD